jgi:hypothetical protein
LIAWHTRLTVDLDSAASGPSASPSAASTSRTLRPRTNPEMTSASSALVRLTPLAKQPRDERLGGAANLLALQHHRPSSGLHRQLGMAIAGRGPFRPPSRVT